MERYVTFFSPEPQQILGLIAVLIVGFGFVSLGSYIGGIREERYTPADLTVGWGVACLVITLFGVALPINLMPLAVGLAIVAGAMAYKVWRRDSGIGSPEWPRLIALTALLFIMIAGMIPSQWDEFSHWLYASGYLVEVDAFPRHGLPPSGADFPAYPYGVSLITYLVSRVAQHFVDNAGPLFNILLLLSFALAVIDLIYRGLNKEPNGTAGWGISALAILAVTLLSPTFVAKINLTAYADAPTAAAVGIAGVLTWRITSLLAEGNPKAAMRHALQLGLVLAALVNSKQANPVHVVFLTGGLILVGLRDPKVRISQVLRLLPLTLGPAILIYAAWRYHVTVNMDGREFGIRPFDQWNFDLLDGMIANMINVIVNKGGYFGLSFIATGFGIAGLFRFKSDLDRLAIITGTAFLAYNAFLFFAYLAIFGGWEAEHAASYWRYNLHMGLLVSAFGVYGLAVLWRRWIGERRIPYVWPALIAITVAMPVIVAPILRFDDHAPKREAMLMAREMRQDLLPQGARVFILDPHDNGFYSRYMQYHLYPSATIAGYVRYMVDGAKIRKQIDNANPAYIWVHTVSDGVREAVGINLADAASYLLEKDGDGWKLIKTWPFHGYNLPSDIPD